MLALLYIAFYIHFFFNYHNLSFSEQFPLFKKAHNNRNISLQLSEKYERNFSGKHQKREKQHVRQDV